MGIFWISSYPKSGNTWIRAIIASLIFTKDGVFNFDLLKKISLFDLPKNYNFIGENFEPSKLNNFSKFRLEAQKKFIKEKKGEIAFLKTHSANLEIKNFEYTNPKYTSGFIYVVRDPRDIVISWANHQNITLDNAINFIINKETIVLSPRKTGNLEIDKLRIPMHISSWEQHFMSWTHLKVPRLIIRYEDMLQNTEGILKSIIMFLENFFDFNFTNKKNLINNILLTTSFEEFKKNEQKTGFDESISANNFFNSGQSGQWKKVLSKKQIDKIEKNFYKTMANLGYI